MLFKKLREELNAVLLSLLGGGSGSGSDSPAKEAGAEESEGGESGGDQAVNWRAAKGRKVVDAVVVLLEAEQRDTSEFK